MAPFWAALRRSARTLERRFCTSRQVWLLLLAHDACRRHLDRRGPPLLDDAAGPPVPATITPLTCDTTGFAISRELDGRLSRRERRAVRDHVRRCPVCARLAAAAHAQRAALRQLAQIPVPASIDRKVFARDASS